MEAFGEAPPPPMVQTHLYVLSTRQASSLRGDTRGPYQHTLHAAPIAFESANHLCIFAVPLMHGIVRAVHISPQKFPYGERVHVYHINDCLMALYEAMCSHTKCLTIIHQNP